MAKNRAKSILDLFNQYAGREINVVENGPVATLNENNPLIQEIRKLAEDNGLRLRIKLPGMRFTMEVNNNRVNFRAEKKNGQWLLSKPSLG